MSFLQTEFWAEFKSQFGWTFSKHIFSFIFQKKEYTTELFVLHRRFKGGFSLSYVPLAPILPQDCLENYTSSDYFELISTLVEDLRKNLPRKTLFIRFDFPPIFPSLNEKDVFLQELLSYAKKSSFRLKKAPSDIQSPDTVVLDLKQSEEALLANMKAKWRYNIRLAAKKGVEIAELGEKGLASFYTLYEETAKRDGIAIHSYAYYEALFRLVKSYPQLSLGLYVAKHEDDILAAIITLFTKEEAVYLYGASSNTKRNLMATYLLQWTAIKDAKIFGSQSYDFYGIPPVEDETHPMYGLYRFKTGFGGEIIHRVGSVDIPLSPFYTFYVFAEKVRYFWFKKIKKLFVKKAS